MTEDVNVKMTVDAGQSIQATNNYKKTLKDLKDQMVELQVSTNGLADATEEQRAQYAALEQQAGQIADALGDVSARVQANADDFQGMSAAMEGLKGGIGALQGIVGATELLGINNTGVEKFVKTMLSLQGIMSSLNAVQQVFNKDSKVRIALQRLVNSGIVAEGVATQGATVAQKAFNIALKSCPIFILVGVITSVIAAYSKLKDSQEQAAQAATERHEEEMRQLEELRDKNKQLANEIANRDIYALDLKSLIELRNSTTDNFTKMAAQYAIFEKATGRTAKNITEAYNVTEKVQQQFADSVQKVFSERIPKAMSRTGDAMQNYKDLTELLAQQQENLTQATRPEDIEFWKNAVEKTSVKLQTYKQIIADAEKEVIKLNKAHTTTAAATVTAVANDYSELEKINSNYLKQKEDAEARTNKYIEAEQEKTLNGKKKNLKAEYESIVESVNAAKSQYADYYNSLSEEQKAHLGENLLSIEEFNNSQDELQKKALQNYKNEVAKVNEEIRNEGIKSERERIDNENKVDSEILQVRLDNLKEGSEEYFELQQEIEEERWEQQMEDLRRRLEDKQLTQAEFDELETEYFRQHQQNMTAIQDEEDRKRIELTENRISTVGSILSNMSNFVSTLMETELEEAEGNERKQKEIKKKYATAQAMMKIGQIGIDTALGIMGVWSQVMELGPIAGPILGAVLSATIGALGAANTVKAIQEKNKIMKAKRGAYVVGPSHENGGVPYELEGGEVVLNKKAMSIPAYRSIASAMNVSTGGVAFPGTSGAGLNATIPEETVASIVRQTVAGIVAIPVEVSEESITNTIRKVGVLESHSRI